MKIYNPTLQYVKFNTKMDTTAKTNVAVHCIITTVRSSDSAAK